VKNSIKLLKTANNTDDHIQIEQQHEDAEVEARNARQATRYSFKVKHSKIPECLVKKGRITSQWWTTSGSSTTVWTKLCTTTLPVPSGDNKRMAFCLCGHDELHNSTINLNKIQTSPPDGVCSSIQWKTHHWWPLQFGDESKWNYQRIAHKGQLNHGRH